MIMNSYVIFHDLWIHIWIRVYEEYREIIPEFGCTKVPDAGTSHLDPLTGPSPAAGDYHRPCPSESRTQARSRRPVIRAVTVAMPPASHGHLSQSSDPYSAYCQWDSNRDSFCFGKSERLFHNANRAKTAWKITHRQKLRRVLLVPDLRALAPHWQVKQWWASSESYRAYRLLADRVLDHENVWG